jgi:hypothetical protein
MTSRDEREGAKLNRDEHAERTARLGHDVTWKLGPNATRKGHLYFFDGTCANCHAHMSIGSAWSSSHGVLDLRSDKPCSGPGTHILTDIEAARRSELLAPAIAEFAGHVRATIAVTAALN